MKKNIDTFIDSFDTFIRSTSPRYWRVTGTAYNDLKKLKDTIEECEPLTYKDLENAYLRDQVLTDEEKELYNNSNKYNL